MGSGPYFLLNWEMVFVAVLVGVAVLAGLAVWAFRRRGSDEMHSVAGYQHRLERLEEVRRRQIGSVRVVGGSTPGRGTQPTVGEDGRIEISSSRVPPGHRRHQPAAGSTPSAGAPSTYRRGPRHLDRPDEPPTPPPRRAHRRRGRGDRAGHRAGHRRCPLAHAALHDDDHHLAHRGGRHRRTTTTTTTTAKPTTFTADLHERDRRHLPAAVRLATRSRSRRPPVTATSRSPTPTVRCPTRRYCTPGQTQQLMLTGSSQVNLGAPSYAQVQVDRTPVTFPSPVPAPLVLVLNAASSGSTSSTTTSTT